MNNPKRCPDCDHVLATEEDDKKYPEGEGEHLCWRLYANDTCEHEPVNWRLIVKYTEPKIRDAMEMIAQLPCGCIGDEGPTLEELNAVAEAGHNWDGDAVYHIGQYVWRILQSALEVE